ncbi:MAG: NUDIX domain-containing protein [Patescibacteria group bacterium]
MQTLADELKELLKNKTSIEIIPRFLERFSMGNLTRDEDNKSHFCAYFAAYDPNAKEVFIGHHKKSGLWLFNGGHIDKDENLKQSVMREIGEEWGLDGNDFQIGSPALFTITEIDNPTKQACKHHYDLWYFIEADKNEFKPEESKLMEEFHEAGWKKIDEAQNLIKGKNTLLAIEFVKDNYFSK